MSPLASAVFALLVAASSDLPALPAVDAMKIAAELAELAEFEGFRSTVYLGPAGFPTIGYGHRCRADHPAVDEESAYATLLGDTCAADEHARRLVPNLDDLPESAQHAVVHMIFQLGAKGFYNFANLRKALQIQDFKAAAREALASRWANQNPTRARFVASLFLGKAKK